MTYTASPMLANVLARSFLLGLEEIMGNSGMKAAIQLSGIERLRNDYPAPTSDLIFPFSDLANIMHVLSIMYGEKGQRSLLKRAGCNSFPVLSEAVPAIQDAIEHARRTAGTGTKSNLIIKGLAQTLSTLMTTAVFVQYNSTSTLLVVEECPCCWGQQSATLCCYWLQYLLTAGLTQAFGTQLPANLNDQYVTQQSCRAAGAAYCSFLTDFPAIDAALPAPGNGSVY